MPSNQRRTTRLFLDRDLSRDSVDLPEKEANYLGNVLRLRRGDPVLLFNGRGQERHGTIALLARRQGEVRLSEAVEPLPESALELTLIQALPKTEAMDLVVQKITELGVHALWPITTDFSVVKLDADRAARRAEHWLRIAQSACEQCGRHRPPEIRPVASLAGCVADVPEGATRLVLDTTADRTLDGDAPAPRRAFLLVGPEGGFSPTDLDFIASSGFERIRLGPRTLRAETAAIVACGLLQALWGDLLRLP